VSKAKFWGLIFLPLTLLAVGMEAWAGFDSSPNTVPWTSYIVHNVPWPMTALGILFFIVWLPYHFWQAYHKAKKAAYQQGKNDALRDGRRIAGAAAELASASGLSMENATQSILTAMQARI
jgi:cbb3-type cytochrome oxidase subunit 3